MGLENLEEMEGRARAYSLICVTLYVEWGTLGEGESLREFENSRVCLQGGGEGSALARAGNEGGWRGRREFEYGHS